MNSRQTLLAFAVFAVAGSVVSSVGATSYNEANSPDLSDSPSAPTPFPLTVGANTLTGTAGFGDFDLVHITVPAGNTLASLVLDNYSNPFNAVSFVGLAAGATWQAGLDFDVDPTYLLGWAHISASGSTGIGHDLLIPMSTSIPPGFQRPLAAGEYSLLIQDTDNTVGYSLTFNVVPTTLHGDFNRDDQVTSADIPAMLIALTDLSVYALTNSLSPAQLAAIGDFDNSGSVTNRDIQGLLDLVASQGGSGTAAAVPEPTTLMLLFLAVAGLGLGRARSA
jgi:hypothetical protein